MVAKRPGPGGSTADGGMAQSYYATRRLERVDHLFDAEIPGAGVTPAQGGAEPTVGSAFFSSYDFRRADRIAGSSPLHPSPLLCSVEFKFLRWLRRPNR